MKNGSVARLFLAANIVYLFDPLLHSVSLGREGLIDNMGAYRMHVPEMYQSGV